MPAGASPALVSGRGGALRPRWVGLSAVIAFIIWLLYRLAVVRRDRKKVIHDGTRTPRLPAPPAEPDSLEHTLSGGAMQDVAKAAEKYDDDYRQRMSRMVAPKVEQRVRPFIGFSLADNIKAGALIVDGVFADGPAFQVGVNIDHELLSIAGHVTVDIEHTLELVMEHCRPGHITRFGLKTADGIPYEAEIWVMTSDANYRGKPYYFDPSRHPVRQSDRLKRTWQPSQERERSQRSVDTTHTDLQHTPIRKR